MTLRPRPLPLARRLVILSAVALTMAIGGPAIAAYIEPSNFPPGGRSATFITTSATDQQKLGSLIIGDQVGGDTLCLNAPATGSRSGYCLSAWSSIGNILGPFVRLNTETITNPDVVSSYQPYLQTGFAHVKGTGTDGNATYQSDPATTTGTKVGVFADNASDTSSYAAYFFGRLNITQHGDALNTPGQLCLNGTSLYNPAAAVPRYGCIAQWTDLVGGPVGAYIKLQTNNPPSETQVGGVWLWGPTPPRPGAWQFGNGVTVGGVTNGVTGTPFCGDYICSAQIGETQSSCPTDCGTPPPTGGGGCEVGCDEPPIIIP